MLAHQLLHNDGTFLMKTILKSAAAGVFSLALSTFAMAADAPSRKQAPAAPPAPSNDWSAEITLYGWAIGINGTVQIFPRLPPVHANVGFDELLKNLDGGIMLSASAMADRYVFFGDLIYAKVSPKKNFRIDPRYDLSGTVTLDVNDFMGLAAGGYRVYADPTTSLDLMIGARVFSVGTSLNFALDAGSRQLADAQLADRTKTWVDGVVGVRAVYKLTENVRLTGIAFGGGLSSKYEWDLFASIGYDFTKNWSAFVGYRALGVNYQSDGFVYDVVQQGPLIGISARF